MAPLPKGRTNNPNWRPKVESQRVMFASRIAPETANAINAEADRREVSRGALLDEIVAAFFRRKR